MQNKSRLNVTLVIMMMILCGGCRTTTVCDQDAPRLERMLVFSATAWYRHDAIPEINTWLQDLGRSNGFEVHATEDPGMFTRQTLAGYQVVLFNNTTDIGKLLDEQQRSAFVDWFSAGGGYVGIHAASVHHKTWPWYEQMLGTDFNSDVELQPGLLHVNPEHRDHPAVRGFGPTVRLSEEWMNYETSVRGLPDTMVLLTLDESSIDTTVKRYFQDKGGRPMGEDHPVAWARHFAGGRVFYTNLGHGLEALQTDFGRAHLLGGIRWAAGAAACPTDGK